MSNASNRNFGLAARERDRRIASDLDSPGNPGTAQSGYLGPEWDAFSGALREKAAEAAANGMGFRADLSGIGSEPTGALPGPGAADTARSIAVNKYLGQLTDENFNKEQARQGALSSLEADIAAGRDKQAFDRASATAYAPGTSATGRPIVPLPGDAGPSLTPKADTRYVTTGGPQAPADPRQMMLNTIPGHMRPAMEKTFAEMDQKAAAAKLAQSTLDEKVRHDKEMETAQDPTNPKRQQALEQQYRGVLQRTLSSRSGGMGLEDNKVNQAVHLISLFDQNKDPKTGEYNIPKAQYAELAMGLAALISGTGRATDSAREEIETRTAKGDIAGALTYLTGKPITGSTQDIFKMLRDSIERQGTTAEANRESYFNAIRAMAPTDLADERRQKLEESLKLNSLGKKASAEQKPIPGIPGGVAELRDGKWIRVR